MPERKDFLFKRRMDVLSEEEGEAGVAGVHQGSPEWQQLRLGIPTASRFGDVMARSKRDGKPLKARINYMYKLVAERIAGRPAPKVDTPAMQRGRDLEPTVIELYEMRRSLKVGTSGFVFAQGVTDQMQNSFGCSPDGLVGEDGLLEVKTTDSHLFVEDILGNPNSIPERFYWQMVGQCLVTQRSWCDLAQYCDPMAVMRIVRLEPPEKDLSDLFTELFKFVNELDLTEKRVRQMLDNMGWTPIT